MVGNLVENGAKGEHALCVFFRQSDIVGAHTVADDENDILRGGKFAVYDGLHLLLGDGNAILRIPAFRLGRLAAGNAADGHNKRHYKSKQFFHSIHSFFFYLYYKALSGIVK